MDLCIYCRTNPASSKDHIFSQFLGGKRSVPACNDCNNKVFGGGFEGRVSKMFLPLMLHLTSAGATFKRRLLWKNARVDSAGAKWDWDSRSGFVLSGPQKVPNRDLGSGEGVPALSLVFPDRASAEAALAKLVKSGQKAVVIAQPPEWSGPERDILGSFTFQINADVARLALKMSIAAASLFGLVVEVDPDVRTYLLKAENHQCVMIATSERQEFESLNLPPFAHSIYVEGDPERGLCHSVVRLFGGVYQLYCILSRNYKGESSSSLAVLDFVNDLEDFRSVDFRGLTPPPVAFNVREWDGRMLEPKSAGESSHWKRVRPVSNWRVRVQPRMEEI